MKITLSQQIDEVSRELKQRADVYPRLVSKGSLRQSVADYQIDRMRAVKRTLEWLAEREDEIRAHFGAPPTEGGL